eukprot:scaffold5977_cov103-Isochrysis_galbana.AAC.6
MATEGACTTQRARPTRPPEARLPHVCFCCFACMCMCMNETTTTRGLVVAGCAYVVSTKDSQSGWRWRSRQRRADKAKLPRPAASVVRRCRGAPDRCGWPGQSGKACSSGEGVVACVACAVRARLMAMLLPYNIKLAAVHLHFT